jgi:hypothetical protein
MEVEAVSFPFPLPDCIDLPDNCAVYLQETSAPIGFCPSGTPRPMALERLFWVKSKASDLFGEETSLSRIPTMGFSLPTSIGVLGAHLGRDTQ